MVTVIPSDGEQVSAQRSHSYVFSSLTLQLWTGLFTLGTIARAAWSFDLNLFDTGICGSFSNGLDLHRPLFYDHTACPVLTLWSSRSIVTLIQFDPSSLPIFHGVRANMQNWHKYRLLFVRNITAPPYFLLFTSRTLFVKMKFFSAALLTSLFASIAMAHPEPRQFCSEADRFGVMQVVPTELVPGSVSPTLAEKGYA